MNKRHIFAIIAAFCIANSHAQVCAFTDRKAVLQALEQAEDTFGNPLSTAHDEAKYVEVLRAVCDSELLSEADKMRPKLLLADALKNQIGTQAADIEYVTTDGSAHLIYDSTAPLTLIYFNDPDCESCEKVKHRLDTCTTLQSMVAGKRLEIVGIYTLDDEQAWKSTNFPTYIINGWNKSQDIEQNETYSLPTLPLFYLLDSDKKVLLKGEASLNRVLRYLHNDTTK